MDMAWETKGRFFLSASSLILFIKLNLDVSLQA